MARPDDRRRLPRGRTRARGGRADGGFGPWGPPRPPVRERRPDTVGAKREPPRSKLRMRGERRGNEPGASTPRARRAPMHPHRRPRRPSADVEREILNLGGRRGRWLLDRLMAAADAYRNDRDREALGLVRPVRDAIPDAPSVRELCGLAHYRLGNYRAAARELEAFVELTGSVDQHPVLMDCCRAQRRWRRVDELWDELAAASPSAELVTEGRIVAAGARADRGLVDEAIGLLARKASDVKRPRAYHLRLWYALGDLEERAGNHPRARELFARIHRHDPGFVDVSARRAALH